MKIRLLLILVGLAIAFALPTFAQHTNKIITVLPTNSDDTANLQSAFDKAVAEGPGVTVRLVKGIYKIRQIVANNFKGAFIGAGAGESVLTNLSALVVTQPNVWYNAPPTPYGGTNTWPSLVVFVNGDFLVSDMGISVTDEVPTTGYTIAGNGPLYDVFQGFGIVGTMAKATFLRVDVKGKEFSFGPNVINGIFFWGASTGPLEIAPPISGSFVVTDSMFQSVESATPVVNVSDASILISRNTSEAVRIGGEVSGLRRSWYVFSFNTVQGSRVIDPTYGCAIYDFSGQTVPNVTSSEILISYNVFNIQSSTPGSVSTGIGIAATFAGGSRCQILSNNFEAVTVLGIYLGPGTSHCIVAGNSQTTIQNMGTDNVIIDKSSAP